MAQDKVSIGVELKGVEQAARQFGKLRDNIEGAADAGKDLSRAFGNSNLAAILKGIGSSDVARAARLNDEFIASRAGFGGRYRYQNLGQFFDSPMARMQMNSASGMRRRAEILRGLGLDAAAMEHGAGWRVTHRRGGFFTGAAHGAAQQMGLGRLSDIVKNVSGGEEGAGMMGAFKGGAAAGVGFGVAQLAIQALTAAVKTFVVPAMDAAKSIDSLKRRTGDLGGSFGSLIKEVNKSVDGLGVSYKEGGALAVAMTKVAGSFQGGDLRAAIGFARASGMDLGASTDFFGTMRRMGDIGSGESEMKRFAYLIGQAVTASGYSGNVEAITKAVAAFATTSARFGLSTPNVGAYLGAFAGLTRTGIPGLDPEGAAALLGRADMTVRAGGGGRWGTAFLAQALGGRTGDIYATQALWQQGLLGSSAGAFSGPWADMVRQFGGRVPLGSGVTNFTRIKAAFDRVMGGTGTAAPAAFAQLFGLPSAAQGAALHNMSPAALDNLMQSLGTYGVQMKNVSATGMIDFGKVTSARGIAGLLAVRSDLLNRGDLNQADRAYLTGLNGGMGETALRQALGKFTLSREQEDTPVTMFRRFSTDLQDTITELGEKLLDPLGGILNAVNHLAGLDTVLGNNFMSVGNAPGLGLPAGMISGPGGFAAFAAALGQAESSGNPLAKNGSGSGAFGLFQFKRATWLRYGGGGLNIWNPNDQRTVLAREMADAQAHGAMTIEDLTNFHHYGAGGWQGRGPDKEVQTVEHRLVIELTSGGKTIATKTLPLKAGAPLIPAGGAPITMSAPVP